MYDCFVNNHSGDRFAVSFLLRRINTVSLRVYCQAVYFLLNRKVFELAVVLGIVHLEYRDGSARTGHVNALQSRVELDDVGTSGHRQEGNRLLLVEIEHGHQVISFAGEEGAMMFRVQGHPVIPLTAPYRITPYDFIGGRIDDRENVLLLKVDIHLARDWIVLRHPSFTVEMQSLDDFVLGHVHDGFGFPAFVRDIELVKRG